MLSVQGSVVEHINALDKTFINNNIQGVSKLVKKKDDLKSLDALIIPGGESTTISKILIKSGLYDIICKRIENNDLFIMGTCAGCVLLAKEIFGEKNNTKLLSAMEMGVERNAFGRQRESFEQDIKIKGLSHPFRAVFIRAPIIYKVWGKCEIISKIDKKIIAAREDKFLAVTFHPELTNDLRIHEYFLQMIN